MDITIKNIAKKIPGNVRAEILSESDPIANAHANASNENMMFLAKAWYEFIEPTKEMTNCTICLNNILTSFRQMKPYLVELENEKRLLESIHEE
ncbi:MAG: hypothetical protein WBA59_03900 [Moheibacter sp.]